jgi:hypothetical protein
MIGSKSKGLFVDVAGTYLLAARTTGTSAPFTVEEVREIPIGEPAETAEAMRTFAGTRGTGYAVARCGIYPPNRLVSRIAAEGRKLKDEGYLTEHVKETLKIDPAAYHLFLLSPETGADAVGAKTPPKDVLVCGAPSEELMAAQERLLDLGLYPETMEIGTIASLGGVADFLAFSDQKTPTLLLEIGGDSTLMFVVARDGIEITRTMAFGISSMIPVVQKELGLKDEESAKKLFFSNSFDFTPMGPQLTKRLLRELQASIGFYEVQTGQSIAQLCCTQLPSKIGWLEACLADVLGMKVLKFDLAPWLKSKGIEFADSVNLAEFGPMWTNLFCLMGTYQERGQNESAG